MGFSMPKNIYNQGHPGTWWTVLDIPILIFYLSIFCLYVKVDPQISQVADFFDFGGGVEDSRFKTFRFFDSKRELFEKLASELNILSDVMT